MGSTGGSVDISLLFSNGTHPKFTIKPVLTGFWTVDLIAKGR
jgi:hypothetical protein